ncbi:MAG: YdbH domain-containing protein [Erythrobacter sp.]
MADDHEFDAEGPPARRRWSQKRRWRSTLALGVLLVIGLVYVWATREQIAVNVIEEQLQAYELEADYDIEAIGPQEQILRNVVIGDPEDPDLTVERVALSLRYRLGIPVIEQVSLEAPRLYGAIKDGELTFGSLDRVIYAPSDEPAALPDLELTLRDGRARIDSEYGAIGVKAEGFGALDDGFAGTIAAVGPQFSFGDCSTGQISVFGNVTTATGEPSFDGPVRLRDVRCDNSGLNLRQADVSLTLTAESDFSGVESEMDVAIRRIASLYGASEEVNGEVRLQWKDDGLNGRYDLSASQFSTPQVSMASLSAAGSVRALDNFERTELQADIAGSNVAFGDALDATLAGHQANSVNTLFGPLIAKLRQSVKRQQAGNSLSGEVNARQTGDITSIVIPTAYVRGQGGSELLSLSRVQISTAGPSSNGMRVEGNFQSGGDGLPRIRGRMEQNRSGNLALRLAMAEYREGDSALAVPQLTVEQSANGSATFTGLLSASGDLGAANVSNLELPLSGGWSARNGLSVWRKCTQARFATMRLANLTLDQRNITLCPSSDRAIVSMGDAGLQIVAGIPELDLSGMLGESPIRVRTGAIGLALPGVMVANDIDVALGPQETASRFTLDTLQANFGQEVGGTIGGSFANASVLMDQVPLDIVDAGGNWDFIDGVLSLSGGTLRVLDREEEDRFEPLFARDATLSLADNQITAQADLRNPDSDRIVANVQMAHNLESAIGHADLLVDNLRFDPALQPEQLSYLAKGVIALAEGVIDGSGRIDWTGDDVTSGGRFSSDGIDFAAAFGPVEGAKGTIEFTDLVSLTTAPDQRITIDMINPGVEVMNGEILFELTDAELLSVKGGEWPFMGGQLLMRPVDMRIGAEEERRYIFEMVALDAGIFVSELELGNLSASGLFDGTVPIVFDKDGNGRIESGLLLSREPGGNVSYIGELTYEDLSPIANFAFESLRSMDYSQMSVAMEGSLIGEIVTSVRFDGVQQGDGAKRNLLTRQIAKLPIRFNVNIRSQFYQLIAQMKSLYDPAFIRDPRDIGLVADERPQVDIPGVPSEPELPNTPNEPASPAIRPNTVDPEINPDEPSIQTPESETMP